ncbi:hypothetical protein KSS87_008394, partial [Heliosperma pusillum]
AQSLAANNSPTPSVSSMVSPPSSYKSNDNRKPKLSLLATPEQNKKKGPEETVRELQSVVKTLEGAIERLKREHSSQMKKKDDKIRELMAKSSKGVRTGGDEGLKMFVPRASVKPKIAGGTKTAGHRFQSPLATNKKRSFWDITTAHSPSVAAVNGRKTRSYVNPEPAAPPSMLLQLAHPCFWSVMILGPLIANYILQPGFARNRLSPFRQ